jgi:methyl acetate hydrolase
MQDRIDELLGSAVERGDVPGVVAVVVDRDGIRYEGAFGERKLGSGVAMTADTVGWIASMTKAITGAAAMQLVEQGRLDLDAPAAEVCEDLARVTVLEGFDDDGLPIERPPTTTITLRNLLTHTSGFAYEIWNADMARYQEVTGAPSVISLEMAALRVPLMSDPGTRWEYGIGIDWAGQMVEAVTGQTLGVYFAEHLTGPLGMHDTAFAPTPSMVERAAAMHARGPDSSLSPAELPAPEHPEFEMGGGGLFSTMPDYGRFIRMILNEGTLDGARVLAPDTVDQMTCNQMGELRVLPLPCVMPMFSNAAEFFPGDPKSWGLTFQINEAAGSTGRPPGTCMWAGLANSYYWLDRANGIGGAYMTQILPFADVKSLPLFEDFETAVYASMS